MRLHRDDIIKWAKHEDCVVWYYSKVDLKWIYTPNPSWVHDLEYRVIIPEYKDVWQAYLDKKLEVIDSDEKDWIDWPDYNNPVMAPNMAFPRKEYRRKQNIGISVQLNNKEVDPSSLSPELWDEYMRTHNQIVKNRKH